MSSAEAEFVLYCVRPAVELHQRIRYEMHKLDAKFAPETLASKQHPPESSGRVARLVRKAPIRSILLSPSASARLPHVVALRIGGSPIRIHCPTNRLRRLTTYRPQFPPFKILGFVHNVGYTLYRII